SKVYKALLLPAKGTGDAVEALHVAERHQQAILDVLRSLLGTSTTSAKEMVSLVNKAFSSAGVTHDAKVDKAIREAISVPDAEGEVQTDRKGHPLPDPDLRDNENV